MVRTSCPAQQSRVFSRGSPQSPHKALWGHLVAQVAPLVYLRGSPLHSTTTCAKYFSCQCDSQEERHEVKFGGRKYREQVWSGWVWTPHPLRCPWPEVLGCCLLLLVMNSIPASQRAGNGGTGEVLPGVHSLTSGLWWLRSNTKISLLPPWVLTRNLIYPMSSFTVIQPDRSIAYQGFVLIIFVFVQHAEKCLAPAKKSQPHFLGLSREKWECLVTLSGSTLTQVFPFSGINKP